MQVEPGTEQQGGGGTESLDELESSLGAEIAAQLGGFFANQDEITPIGGSFGVHPSFLGPVNQQADTNQDPRLVRLPSPYTKDQVGNLWGTIPSEHKIRTQQALLALGFINPTEFNLGRMQAGKLDPTTRSAFEQLLGMANAEGVKWNYLIDNMISQRNAGLEGTFGAGGPGSGGTAAPAYLPPDPATLRQVAMKAVEGHLGREAIPEEVQNLSSHLSTWSRQQFDAAVNGGTQVDPAARLEELIQDKYATELDLIDERNEFAQNTGIVQQNMSFVDQMSRGVL